MFPTAIVRGSQSWHSHDSPLLESMKSMELLAPAGGMEQLRAALHFGADAVYLGSSRFGLRTRADNFTPEQLRQAVQLAHARGAKVYVTANALIHPGDAEGFAAHLRDVQATGADAVLVSDLGAFAIAREAAPGLPLHVSTQASVTNAAAAQMYANLGAERVVLARELSLDEISRIREALDPTVQLEVFVHGAMCMAYSGRCLISNFLTGRDANRGSCAQPCRWSYALEEEKRPGEFFPMEEEQGRSFVLSSADLAMLDHLDDLRAAGVDSLKIEGRVKSAYYVSCIVNVYRQVLDGRPAAELHGELDAVSHRPYSTGFFYGNPQQALHGKEYSQTCDFIGTVEACEPVRDKRSAFVAANADGIMGGDTADSKANVATGNAGSDPDGGTSGGAASVTTNLAGSTASLAEQAGGIATDDTCNPAAHADRTSGAWRVRTTLRNRFRAGDPLEVLAPNQPIRSFCPVNVSDQDGMPVAEAVKTAQTYTFDAPFPLQPDDILRKRR
jgi:putative protease